jgi:hypothetical protein
MQYPQTTFAGQKITICNRYIELFRDEHNSKADGVLFRNLRADLNAIMPVEYHTHRLIWLKQKWADVLNGNTDLDFPGIEETQREEATNRMNEALPVLKRFQKWQREEHDVTVKRLFHERHLAEVICQNDLFHSPAIADFMLNGLPSQNPLNVSTNFAYIQRLQYLNPVLTEDQRQTIGAANAATRKAAQESDYWDNRLDMEAIRWRVGMPEPPDPLEDFTTWSPGETDPPTGVITVTPMTVSWVNFNRQVDRYHVDDKGVNAIDGDFEYLFRWKMTAMDNSAAVYSPMVANLLDDGKNIADVSGDFLANWLGKTPTAHVILLQELDGGSLYQDTSINLSLNTNYYAKFKRVESTGTHGTGYTLIFDDPDRTSSVDNLSITLHTSKKDYRYLYAVNSYNSGHNIPCSGEVGDFDLQEVVLFQAAWARNSNQLIGVSQ